VQAEEERVEALDAGGDMLKGHGCSVSVRLTA
jgi:hypothetical protein